MKEGRLGYNIKTDRFGMLISDLWENDGFQCGQSFYVKIDNEWIETRIEMDSLGQWYLYGTDLNKKERKSTRSLA